MTPTPAKGDLVLGSGPTHPMPERRGPWSTVATGEGWAASASPGTSGWAGYHLAAVPADGAPSGWHAWFVGEATDGDATGAAGRILDATAAGRDADAAALAAALHGSWLLLARDADGRLHAWTDRFGTIHGFVAAHEGRVALGTSQAAVAAAVGAGGLDWAALAAWCTLGFFPGDRTAEDRVQVVRPATHLVVDPDGSRTEARTWWWCPDPDHTRSTAATVTALDDVLADVLGRQSADVRLALPISGGLDSRTTVAVLTAHPGRHPTGDLWAYSYGYEPSSIETRIGAQIAAARHLQFSAWTIEPYLLGDLDRADTVMEGAQDLTQTRQLDVIDRVAARADRVLAAHWGDVWLDDMGFAATEPGPDAVLAEVRRKFTKPGSAWLVEHLVRAHVPDTDAIVGDLLETEFAPYRAIDGADAQARAFKTDQWSFRWTLPSLRAHHAGLAPRLPFYDGRVADLFLTVPAPMVAGRSLQIEHLRRTSPDLARITWQHAGTGLDRLHLVDTWLKPARVARGLGRRVRERRSGAPVLSRNWEVQFGGKAGRAALRENLLGSSAGLADVMPAAPIEQLLRDLDARPHDAEIGYATAMLLTLSTWLARR